MTAQRFNWLCIGILMQALSAPAWSQIPQDRPALCGNPDRPVPVPPGIVAITALASADITLTLSGGSRKSLELTGPNDGIRQVCPLNHDRLLVFGPVNRDDGYIVWIISQVDGVILDVFGARNPQVSPDQHWLVYRQRYPSVVENVFEQYLLYDLTKTPAENASANANPHFKPPPGRMEYPVTAGRTRLENLEVAPGQRHEFASETFFWSPDSRFVVFGDRMAGHVSVVAVSVVGKDTVTYLHQLFRTEICDSAGPKVALDGFARLSNVDFGIAPSSVPRFSAHFSLPPGPGGGEDCTKAPLFHSGNLMRAAVETHPRTK